MHAPQLSSFEEVIDHRPLNNTRPHQWPATLRTNPINTGNFNSPYLPYIDHQGIRPPSLQFRPPFDDNHGQRANHSDAWDGSATYGVKEGSISSKLQSLNRPVTGPVPIHGRLGHSSGVPSLGLPVDYIPPSRHVDAPMPEYENIRSGFRGGNSGYEHNISGVRGRPSMSDYQSEKEECLRLIGTNMDALVQHKIESQRKDAVVLSLQHEVNNLREQVAFDAHVAGLLRTTEQNYEYCRSNLQDVDTEVIHTYIHTYIYIYMYVCLCICIVYTCALVYYTSFFNTYNTHTHTYIYIYILHTHTHIYIYIYIYIYCMYVL